MGMISSRYTGREENFAKLRKLHASLWRATACIHIMARDAMGIPSRFLAAPLLCASIATAQDGSAAEVRGAWVATEDLGRLSTRREVDSAMELLAESGLNVVFFPVAAGAEPAERDLLAEVLFEAHRRGLEVLPWFEPGDTPEDEVLLQVIKTCKGYDLDGVVVTRPFGRIRKEVESLDPELAVVAPAGAEIAEEAAPIRLPKIVERAPEKAGDVVIGLAKLLEKEGELARALREGPFAEEARLPWRKVRARRPPSAPIEAFAGSGVWTWMSVPDEPRFLAMDGGEVGHASWKFEPPEKGTYLLYAWIPSREDLAQHSSYKLASAGSSRTVGIDTREARNRGWIYLGESRLEAGKPIEIARLEAEEQDATKITAAGPFLALLSRRTKPR
jgi:hypothetical protein